MDIKYLQSKGFIAKPFIKWVGGKGQLISSIEKLLPEEVYGYSDMTYIEAFVGGGAMLFWILRNAPAVKKAVINDINPDLTNAYRTVKENVYELIILLKNIQREYHSLTSEESRKEYFLKMRERYNTKSLDNIENTALFIFLNRTCFNGLYRVNSKGLFNVPFGKYTNPTICDENTLLIDNELLQKVEIL
ncbi:MAG: Dam family site-specific DNA-(adenine-N6)-methyltransferase, partial [Bacteroidales bacterium]|nr:Dam family site-specific DNA-(adenine-N6)-methyltransferase [Bacteroidales bacterium]